VGVGLVFTLPGLVLAAAALQSFLALTNPRLRVMVSSAEVPLGASFDLAWAVSDAGRLRSLRVWLEGSESADAFNNEPPGGGHGSHATFATFPISEADRPGERGSARVSVPASTMHSFEASADANNKILWSIRFAGKSALLWGFWPATDVAYGITVLPVPVIPLSAEPSSVYVPGGALKGAVERIDGMLSISIAPAPGPDRDDGGPDPTGEFEVRLGWRTRGKGNTDQDVVATVKTGRDFWFRLPADGPYSFSGKLVSLVWAVEAERGSWPRKETVRQEFILSPTGREIELYR